MDNVIFIPWVGEFYNKYGFNNKRILILGESHYCEEDCNNCLKPQEKCDFTIDRINEYLNYKNGKGQFINWMRTFTKFTNVFFGEICTIEYVNKFWNSIIFYNYVQKATERPRQAPTRKMFEESQNAFFEILNEYNPDVVFVWGQRLWNNRPDNGYWGEKNIFDDNGGKFYYYKSKLKNIPTYYVYHPSTSKFTYDCTKYLKEVIKLI